MEPAFTPRASIQFNEVEKVERKQLAFVATLSSGVIATFSSGVIATFSSGVIATFSSGVIATFSGVIATFFFTFFTWIFAEGSFHLGIRLVVHHIGTAWRDRRFRFATTHNNHQCRNNHCSKKIHILHLLFPSKGLRKTIYLSLKISRHRYGTRIKLENSQKMTLNKV
jgi:hypothetical protein